MPDTLAKPSLEDLETAASVLRWMIDYLVERGPQCTASIASLRATKDYIAAAIAAHESPG